MAGVCLWLVFCLVWLSWRSDCSFLFLLEGPECLSKVSTLAFWETYPCGVSVTFHSPQMSLGNFHIMAFVDRLLGWQWIFLKNCQAGGKRIKEKTSFYLKHRVKLPACSPKQGPRSQPDICSQRQPRRVGSLKINVILSLQRSKGTLPLNSIYLHKIELPLMLNHRWWKREEEPLPLQSGEGHRCLIGQAEQPKELAGSPGVCGTARSFPGTTEADDYHSMGLQGTCELMSVGRGVDESHGWTEWHCQFPISWAKENCSPVSQKLPLIGMSGVTEMTSV